MTNAELIARARAVVRPRKVGEYTIGNVGCALLSAGGSIYTGVCIDVGSGMGFCAEHSAAAAMVTAGEYRIAKIVAVVTEGPGTYILSPCGRCREFLRQLDDANLEAEVVLDDTTSVMLADLLPRHDWYRKVEVPQNPGL